jgi:hypothetical protein
MKNCLTTNVLFGGVYALLKVGKMEMGSVIKYLCEESLSPRERCENVGEVNFSIKG